MLRIWQFPKKPRPAKRNPSAPWSDSCDPLKIRSIRVPVCLLCPGPTNINRDAAPPTLIEPQHAQRAPRHVPRKYRNPDVDRVEPARPLNDQTDAERND